MITCPVGKYSEVVTLARKGVNISELKIEAVKARRAATGALIYEISGEDRQTRADAFAKKLAEVLAGKEGVRVSRPYKKGEFRLRGLDEAVTVLEVVEEVAKVGGCKPQEIRTGEVRFETGGMGTLWVQCPIAAADRVVAAGSIKLGWIAAGVESLKTRPLQCYRCMGKGHVREQCSD